MRVGLSVVLMLGLAGCATTVGRASGPIQAPGGKAENACESASFLVFAPTRYQLEDGRTSRSNGTGVYRVGESHPESLPALDEELGGAPLTQRRARAVAPHDRDRVVAAGLGVGALTALTVGALVFVSAFDTETVTRADGSREEEQKISGGRAGGGGLLVAVGFGMGIAGLIVNPDAAERATADRQRYVLTTDGDVNELGGLLEKHNGAARQRCAVSPAP